MAAVSGRGQCVTCEGCLRIFCLNHLNKHRQDLSDQLVQIENDRDAFQEKLTTQKNEFQSDVLIDEVNRWEKDSIEKLQQTASKCREKIAECRIQHFNSIEINLNQFTDRLKTICQEDDVNEVDLNNLQKTFTLLGEELNRSPNIVLRYDSTGYIREISVKVPSGKRRKNAWKNSVYDPSNDISIR